MNYTVAIMHSFDPRGSKVGGLETFVRDMIRFQPVDVSMLVIGVDGRGDATLGEIIKADLDGHPFDFLPVVCYPDEQAREAAGSILQSINLRFFLGLIRYLPRVRRELKSRGASVDLQRVEYSVLTRGLGIPFVQMLHGEGAPKLNMDSLLKKYRFVHNMMEAYAVRTCEKFLCVNPLITERIRDTYPKHRDKIDTLSTWVDTRTFRAQPFPAHDSFKIAFAGRLDLFKVPALMFKTIDRLAKKLPVPVELHYMGTSDPERFAEFDLVRGNTVRHGFKNAASVAEVLAGVHAGILTSEMEGMPFFVLETLASGRPVCAVNLPQLESVIRDGESGALVPRLVDQDAQAETLADAFVNMRNLMINGHVTPAGIASHVRNFTPERQLGRAFQHHREIQGRAYSLSRQAVS